MIDQVIAQLNKVQGKYNTLYNEYQEARNKISRFQFELDRKYYVLTVNNLGNDEATQQGVDNEILSWAQDSNMYIAAAIIALLILWLITRKNGWII